MFEILGRNPFCEDAGFQKFEHSSQQVTTLEPFGDENVELVIAPQSGYIKYLSERTCLKVVSVDYLVHGTPDGDMTGQEGARNCFSAARPGAMLSALLGDRKFADPAAPSRAAPAYWRHCRRLTAAVDPPMF